MRIQNILDRDVMLNTDVEKLLEEAKANKQLRLERLAAKLKMNELTASSLVQSCVQSWHNHVAVGKLNKKVVAKLKQTFAVGTSSAVFGARRLG